MKDQSEDFADQLGRYLVRAGFTQQELASRIGMHRNTVVKWMNRTSRPTSRGQVLRVSDELFLSKQERKALIQAAGFSLELWPTEVWTVPQHRDMFFTGREDVIQSLRELLVPGSTMALTQAISGLGGIGKTHTAIEYAYRYHKDYEAVLWLQADSWEVLVSECIKLADELGLPEQKESDKIVVAVQQWLRKHRQWLLILDNIEDPQKILPKFVPTDHQGCILVTTRVQSVEPLAQTQILLTMTEQEGVLFLLRRTTRIASKVGLEKASLEQYDEARQIWQIMDGLPLALDQGGAYILETSCSFPTYREQYTRRRAELLRQRGKRFIGHEASVATTFSLAFERVEALSPIAADILRTCSLLHSEAIPEELFEVGAEHLGPYLGTVRDNLDLALGVLQDYSLMQRNPDARTMTVHRLVQAVLQDAMQASVQKMWIMRVIKAINAIFPLPDLGEEYKNWSQCERLLEHALACATHTRAWKDTLNEDLTSVLSKTGQELRIGWMVISPYEDLASLLSRTALYLQSRARYEEAEPLYKQALPIRERIFGPNHPGIASLLSDMANLYMEQGKYEQAEPLYQRALHIIEQPLNFNDPFSRRYIEYVAKQFTFDLQNALGELYRKQGKYKQSEPLLRWAVRTGEQTFGPDDLRVAAPLNNLANLYFQQGKDEQVEPLLQRVLRIYEKVLGPDHPQISTPLNDLASLYLKQGKYEQAEPLYQRALRIREQTLGLDHPRLAVVLNNLANFYLLQGKYEQAESLYQRALHIREQALGPGHPSTALSLYNLATLYRSQERYAEAEPLYQRALRIREQALGLQHPETAQSMYGLAMLYEAQSNGEEARTWYARSLAINEQALGTHHPETT